MKKLLTSVLTLALVLCCFTFVGCKKEEEPKPATIEQTLAICDQFIADMQAIGTKISAQDYVYPTTDAQASAKQVQGTDKSSIGVEYSNYMDFDFDYYNNSNSPHSTSILNEYYSLTANGEYFADYLDIYKHNNLKLNEIYKFQDLTNDCIYLKLINDNSKICLTIYEISSNVNGYEWWTKFIVNLNEDLTWKSVELKEFDEDSEDGGIYYEYIEKATNSNRLINKYITVNFENYFDEEKFVEIDESLQKMLYLGNYSRDNMNTMQMKADDYLNNLNIENIVDSIDITKAVKIEVNLGE